MRFTATPYRIPGLLLVEGRSFPDERGFFMESFRSDEFQALGLPIFVQDNLSRSAQGVVRGLHYQKAPQAVAKLVRCVRGRIFDVAVDLRRGSAFFGKWASIELSDDGNRWFFIPAGFAHGFYTLSDSADVTYKVTGYWSADVDAGIRWNDPELGIAWPKGRAIVSAKDQELPLLSQSDPGF
ncbi:MAG TPA: dTDP-4-dehydrorhamnose 3,5-epimerase [Elusimicrobia bacterium]|nr:dTDP-4-dehydrorhamnose 3,5-epimerase [Elusimicrobiota bacterium]HBT62401.1 dTDP-4-dehydrorhamnose 3,5-epimerase [Elusimicrobiota bacterium]